MYIKIKYIHHTSFMGRCETATASIGVKILLSDLISQINETNFNVIMEMIEVGFIEDDNDYFNEVYQSIVYDDVMNNGNWLDVKRNLISEFNSKGTINRYKFSNRPEEPTLSNGCLFDKYLLVPVKQILRTARWGYDRNGTNCSSRPMDFDLSVDLEKYQGIDKFTTVFLVTQHSG
jgi:hypothetical protein